MAFRAFLRKDMLNFFSNPLKLLVQLQSDKAPNLKNQMLGNQITKFCTTSAGDKDNKKEKPKAYRHNYHEEVEGAVNNQIHAELNASMIYLSMFCYYGRTGIALPGCQAFFKKMYDEEQVHALDFIHYQLLRGGQVKLFPLTVPENADWTDITIALAASLELEKRVEEKLECLYQIAQTHQDMQLMDMVSCKYVKEQNESIVELGRLLTRAKRLVDTGGVGRHLFDKELFDYVSSKNPEAAVSHYI